MTYELKTYHYNKQTQKLEHTNTIVDMDNARATLKLAQIFVDKNVRGTKTKITYKYEQNGGTYELHITQTWLGATQYDDKTHDGYDYKITNKYEYTFHNCAL